MNSIRYIVPYGASPAHPTPSALPYPPAQYWVCLGDTLDGVLFEARCVFTDGPIMANGVNPTKGTSQPLKVDDDSMWGDPVFQTIVKPTPSGSWTTTVRGIPDATHIHEWREVHLFSSTVIECKHCGIIKPDDKA